MKVYKMNRIRKRLRYAYNCYTFPSTETYDVAFPAKLMKSFTEFIHKAGISGLNKYFIKRVGSKKRAKK